MGAPDIRQSIMSLPIYMVSPYAESDPHTVGWPWDGDAHRYLRRRCMAKLSEGYWYSWDNWHATRSDEANETTIGDKIFFDLVYCDGGNLPYKLNVGKYHEWSRFCDVSSISTVSETIPNSGNMNPFDVNDILNTTVSLGSSDMAISYRTSNNNVIATKYTNGDGSYMSKWPTFKFTTSKYDFDTMKRYVSWNGIAKIVTDDKYYMFSHVNPIKFLTYEPLSSLTSYSVGLFNRYGFTNF